MKHLTTMVCALFAATTMVCAQGVTEFETAAQAAVNMGLGWNLGNTLEANSGDVTNMWIEQYDLSKGTAAYETAWRQPVTTQALIHMFKEAGFSVIRVPVTWYPHMGIVVNNKNWNKASWTPTSVDPAWMARVKEVVDYVINEGMYCILDVHHDTGDYTTAWITASSASYNTYNATFTNLWTEIANTFKDYDEHLVFEGYNEMLDEYGSWNFASYGTAGNYNQSVATAAYNAVNNYAAAFVNAVRATGGNNTYRNLLINTYGGCCGNGSWSTHLKEPLTKLVMPTDPCGNQKHLFVGIHCYPSLQDNNGNWKTNAAVSSFNQSQIDVLNSYILRNYPVIVGEWASANVDSPNGSDYKQNKSLYLHHVQDFLAKCKSKNIVPMYWMGLSDGTHRSVPEFNEPEIVAAMQSVYTSLAEESAATATTAQKIIENGHIVILKDGCKYSVTGLRLGE